MNNPNYSYSKLFLELYENMKDPQEIVEDDIKRLCSDCLGLEGMASDKTDFIFMYLRPMIKSISRMSDNEFKEFQKDAYRLLEVPE